MRRCRPMAAVAGLAVTVALLTGCMPEPGAQSTPAPSPTSTPSPNPGPEPSPTAVPSPEPTEPAATFVSVTDGDTIVTSAGIVRIIGIDAPERGECGYSEANAALDRLLARGDRIELVHPAGVKDRDHYDRLLRFVETETGTDVGLELLEGGHAVARYDSTDGYPRHPRENAYHEAQTATLEAGTVVAVGCDSPSAKPVDPAGDGWWFDYGSCGQLKRNTVGHPVGPFDRDDPAEAEIYDWFANGTGNRGDGDVDGLACE